jgi:outer membrane protein TolC
MLLSVLLIFASAAAVVAEPNPGSDASVPAGPTAPDKPSAGQPPADPEDPVMGRIETSFEKGVTLQDCIQSALRNNLGLRSASLLPKIAAAAVIEEKASFDTVYSATYGFRNTTFPSATVLDGAAIFRSKSNQVETKLTQKLITGGTMEFGFDTTHEKSNSAFAIVNPRSDSSVHFGITQRLLRGFGPQYNRSLIDKAENQRQIEDLRYDITVLELVYRVEAAYWNYVGQMYDLKVREETIKVAEQTVSDVEKRVQARKMLEVDLLEAQEDLANQRLARLITGKRLADTREALVRLIEPYSDSIHWTTDVYVPSLLVQRRYDTNLTRNMQTAMRCRPELQQAALVIDTMRINERASRNEMLPTLNIGYELRWHGLGYQTIESVRDISIDRYLTNTANAYLEYPLFNRAAKSRFTQARYSLERALVETDSLRMDIMVDVRSAIRNVEVLKSAVVVAQRAFELASRKYDAEAQRLEHGQVTLKDFLDFRQQKVRAEVLRDRAKIDYELAINQLEHATATSLTKYDIEIPRGQVPDKEGSAARAEARPIAPERNTDLFDGEK